MSLFPEKERLEAEMKRLIANIIRIMDLTEELFSNTGDRERIRKEIESITFATEEVRKNVTTLVLIAIVRTQPLGRELLRLQSIISAIYDIYRISRYCRELARIDKLLSPLSSISRIAGLKHRFSRAKEAVVAALKDFEIAKPEHWELIAEIDNEIDKAYAELMREIASSELVRMEKALELLAMRHIERIVDHTTYIETHIRNIASL